MKTESGIRPSVQFEIEALQEKDGEECKVILYDNISDAQERNAGMEGEEKETYFQYDRYEVTTTYRAGLAESVEENLEAWIAMAKNAEEAALSEEIREKRNKLLEEIDWTQTIDAPISDESRKKLRVYRQQLRDITEQDGFPYEVNWPSCPEITKADPDPVDEALDILVGQEETA